MARYFKSYKWIDREIAILDPEVDYERIWKLATTYRMTGFQLNFFYVYVFAHFFIAPNGTEVIVREGRGKALTRADDRADDTARHQLTWWEHGPHAEETKRSVQQVNNIHAAIARQYPGRFSNNDDFVYTLCLEATAAHRLREHVGATGFSPAAKTAAYRFWTQMVPLFTAEGGAELRDWPPDFDGLLEFMTRYEAKPWEYSPNGPIALDSVIHQIGARYFPGPLRPLSRPLVLTMLPEHILTILRVAPPPPMVSRIVKNMFRATLLLSETLLPDPKTSISARSARLSGRLRTVRRS